jgi:hypothetical protein
MRLPKEVIGKVRRGELGVLRRPVNNKPCPFKPGRFYALERVDDRHEDNCKQCAGEGCEDCSDHGTVVVYERRATTLEGEFVEVQSVNRQPLHWADDDEAESWGFETREEYIEDWIADHGRNVADTYVVQFRYAVDMPNLLARHGNYTHTTFDAVADEPEAVDRSLLLDFAAHNRAKDTLRKLGATAERLDDQASLEQQLADVRKLAKERNININATERLIQRKIDEIKRKLRDAA